MGAELCLAHDMGRGGGIYLSVDMQPYGCFIKARTLQVSVHLESPVVCV